MERMVPGVTLQDTRACRDTHLFEVPLKERSNGVCHGCRLVGWAEDADAVVDKLGNRARADRHHRAATGHRFQDDEAERLLRSCVSEGIRGSEYFRQFAAVAAIGKY